MKEKEIGHDWFNLEAAKTRSRGGGDDLKGGSDNLTQVQALCVCVRARAKMV